MAPISRYPVPDVAELPDDLRSRIEEVAARSGFVPNVFLALAHRPEELRAFIAYHDAVMERDSGLSKAEREMIVVATSAARSCPYCVVAHGAILRVRAEDPQIADLVATNYRQAPVSARQRAMLDFAVKLSVTPEEVGDADHQVLAAAGFEPEDVWDIAAVVALRPLQPHGPRHGPGAEPGVLHHGTCAQGLIRRRGRAPGLRPRGSALLCVSIAFR